MDTFKRCILKSIELFSFGQRTPGHIYLYIYSSLVDGGSSGNLLAANFICKSLTDFSAVAFNASIHEYPTPSENCSFCLYRKRKFVKLKISSNKKLYKFSEI